MFKQFILLLFLIALPRPGRATMQLPDIVMFKGESYFLLTPYGYEQITAADASPLASYYRANKKTQKPRFQLFADDNAFLTSNTRGYIATWTIKDDALFLIKIYSYLSGSGGKQVALKDLFPGQSEVFASWFTGELSMYRDYMNFYQMQIEAGKVVKIEVGPLDGFDEHCNDKPEECIFSPSVDALLEGVGIYGGSMYMRPGKPREQ